MYSIEINYTTGCSFSSEQRTENIDFKTESYDVIKKLLSYIKDQWILYKKHDNATYDEREAIEATFCTKEWFDSRSAFYCLRIVDENGVEHKIDTFWHGYFETLHSAKIVMDEDEDEINFDTLDWRKL